MRRRRVGGFLVIAIFFSMAAWAAAAPVNVPLRNWAAPSTWTPTAGVQKGGLKAALVTTLFNPLPFVPLTPCRVVDTRVGSGFPAGYGPPALAALATRVFTIGGQCGIPTTAQAVSFQFTAVNMTANGNFRAWPDGVSMPTASVLNWTATTGVIGNGIVVPVGGVPGALDVYLNGLVSSTVDLVLDVNGYYSADVSSSSSQTFTITSSGYYGISGSAVGVGVLGQGGSWGVIGGSAGNAAVGGFGTGTAVGVWGDSTGSHGVFGKSHAGGWAGVRGVNNASTDSSRGVEGFAGGAAKVFGVQGHISASATGGSAGVLGIAAATPGTSFGVLGHTDSTHTDSAGVKGTDATGAPGIWTGYSQAGVRGESVTNLGVFGLSQHIAVAGVVTDSGGIDLAAGYLGSTFGTAFDTTTGPWGVFAFGNLGASGAKHFVEPHPADPSKVIVYSSLEGREVGTYFRGTAHASGGRASIQVPEDFGIVTDEEGLTVQLTPVGEWAQMYVESQDLNQIVIRSSRDVTFHYLVQGVRRAFKGFAPVGKGDEFMPRSAEARMPAYLTEEAKRRLIANGTYNPDGTVNMKTAERMGWAQKWREEEQLRQQAQQAVSRAPQEPGLTPRQ